ncbi:TlpA disulfide reductase family protein [Cytophagaceae bacterium ABcell3]|nr:TlpA disulfide reductase family protein [Cytophagaceae bacterium ABcell3]
MIVPKRLTAEGGQKIIKESITYYKPFRLIVKDQCSGRMKTRSFILFRFAILSAFAFIMAGWQVLHPEDDSGFEKDRMPSFTYTTLEGEEFSKRDLKEGKRYMIVYFNPFCDICLDETQEIIENRHLLDNVQVIMVSPNEKKDVNAFVNSFKLDKYEEITVLHDSKDVFYKDFGATGYPNVFLFNEKKEMLMFFDSGVHVNEVMEIYDQQIFSSKQGSKEKS